MGAQDTDETWVELPFWRQIKYYAIIGLVCFISGVCFGTVALYVNLYQIILNGLWSLCLTYPWLPASLGIGIILVTIIHFKTKPKKLEVKK